MIAGLVFLVLVFDWIAMLFAQIVLRWRGPLLQLVGVILGVTPVALGLKIISSSPSALGVLEMRG